jgi:hypothetical protein
MAGFSDTINNIYSFSFAGSSLITFGLVHITPQQQKFDRNLKSEHHVFVTFAPGEGGGNSRTYNFQKKISIKFSLMEIESLSFVLKNNAETTGGATAGYVKFANSKDGGQKKLSMRQQGEADKRKIQMGAMAGSNNVSITMAPDQAYALSSSLHEMFLMGNKLEIERMMKAPKLSAPKQQNNYTQSPQGYTAPTPDPQPQQQQNMQPTQDEAIGNAADQFSNMVMDNNPF